MSVKCEVRAPLYIDSNLFPAGILPGSIVEVTGATANESSYLITYLIARFLTSYPEKRGIFINVRQSFSMDNFVTILTQLVPGLESLKEQRREDWKYDPVLVSYSERITIINCFTAEDLFFCFGLAKASQLERMLVMQPEFACVFVDGLDSFTYMPSLKSVESRDAPDFLINLKRSVESTGTPTLCVMNNIGQLKRPGRAEATTNEPSSNASQEDPSDIPLPNITFDKHCFTRTLFLQRLDVPQPAEASKILCPPNFEIKAYLRSKNSPKMALSAASHGVKFSIFSGMIKFSSDTD